MPRYSRRRKVRWGRVFSCVIAVALLAAAGGLLADISGEFQYSAAEIEEKSNIVSNAEENSQSTENLPEGWEWKTISSEDLYTGSLILVNSDYAYQSSTETPVSVLDYKTSSYYVKDRNVSLMENVIDHLNDMMDDFAAETGVTDVLLISGWRDPDRQEELYNEDLEEKNQTQSTLVALPGHSEHHTGLALDFGLMPSDDGTSRTYDGTGAYAWINENCQNYGFVVRYPEDKMDLTKIEYEPWHFRYVGEPHAQIMTKLDLSSYPISDVGLLKDGSLCLEEYIELLKSFPLNGEHLYAYGYEICWQEPQVQENGELKIAVPTNQSYTISGDNTGGIIVTAEDTGDENHDDSSGR